MLSSIRSLGCFITEMRGRKAVATVKGVVLVGGMFRGQLDSRDEKPEGTLQSSQISLWTHSKAGDRCWLYCQVRAGLPFERRPLHP